MIEDNCGGIPFDIARDYAFKMGKPSGKGENLATVGVYGIGMKRAIFKLGSKAVIETRTKKDGAYRVLIPDDWINSSQWSFQYENVEKFNWEGLGTKIIVSNLNSNIASNWNVSDTRFGKIEDQLRKYISQTYSYILDKGFVIRVNGVAVPENDLTMLFSPKAGVTPFVSKGTIDDVNWSIIIGLNSPLKEDLENTRSAANAGVTVICNDRVVLYNDKSFRTGWGIDTVPQYHNQFISINGFVTFTSEEPANLPMTTTKRGIDLNSDTYQIVRKEISRGLKMFTEYTNKWKHNLDKENKITSKVSTQKVSNLLNQINGMAETVELKHDTGDTIKSFTQTFKKKSGSNDTYTISPKLPVNTDLAHEKWIRYSKPLDQYEVVRRYLSLDQNQNAGEVGSATFDQIYRFALQDEGEDE